MGTGICSLVMARLRAAGGFGQALAAVDAPLHQAAAAEAGQGTGRVQRPQHPFLGAAPDAHRSTARCLVEPRELPPRASPPGEFARGASASRGRAASRTAAVRHRRARRELLRRLESAPCQGQPRHASGRRRRGAGAVRARGIDAPQHGAAMHVDGIDVAADSARAAAARLWSRNHHDRVLHHRLVALYLVAPHADDGSEHRV